MCFDGLLTTSKLQHWPLSIVWGPMLIQHIYFYSALECRYMLIQVDVFIVTYPQIRYCIVVNRSYNDRLVALLDKFRIWSILLDYVVK